MELLMSNITVSEQSHPSTSWSLVSKHSEDVDFTAQEGPDTVQAGNWPLHHPLGLVFQVCRIQVLRSHGHFHPDFQRRPSRSEKNVWKGHNPSQSPWKLLEQIWRFIGDPQKLEMLVLWNVCWGKPQVVSKASPNGRPHRLQRAGT